MSVRSSGVIIGERISQQQHRVVFVQRLYSSRLSRSNVVNIKTQNVTCKNNSILSIFRVNREDHAICSSNMNMLYRMPNKPHRAMLSTSTNPGGNKNTEDNPFTRRSSDPSEDYLPPITLDNTIRMKNAALATVLVAFCFGIAYYSMHAVGQAGTTSSSNTNDNGDPLAVLKAEAAIAQEKYDKEQQETANTADMLQKFQLGEYDPDHVSDEELDDLIEPKKKRPWYKFW
jgi:hypothetical protein